MVIEVNSVEAGHDLDAGIETESFRGQHFAAQLVRKSLYKLCIIDG
jgi:hypothetical protein